MSTPGNTAQEFCYLGDMVDREGGVRRAVAMRTAAAWSKWREIGGLLCDRGIPLKKRASIYEACFFMARRPGQ